MIAVDLRSLLTRSLVGLAVLGASAGIAWAITHDDAPDAAATEPTPRSIPPLAPEPDGTWTASGLPGGDPATGTPPVPDEDEDADADALAASPLVPLDGAPTTSDAEAGLRAVPAVAMITDDPPASDPATDPATDSDPAPAGSPTIGGPAGLRFVDPCADAPAACAGLLGRVAVGGTIRAVDDPPPPVRILGIGVSGGTSDGCADEAVPAGTRAVAVDLNRPAALSLTWWRSGPVGEETQRPLTDADREAFGVASRAVWSACVSVPFPTTDDRAVASLVVTATADDGTTATHTTIVVDDDSRRLVVVPVDDDEVVAMTPLVGEVTLAGIALRDGEHETDGCRRAAARVLTDRPAPGTEGFRGREVPADLADRIVPTDGTWVAARFTELEESERYAVCLFSVGRDRGDLDGAIQVTDAVLVQPPDRERYEIRPVTLIGPGSIDGRRVEVGIDGCSSGWATWARTATAVEQDFGGEPDGCRLGALPGPETATATVSVADLPTSEATVALPARCTDLTTCPPVGASRLVQLDVAGPAYTRRLCGTGPGACDGGLRRRDEVIGSVIVEITRLESPVGPETFTIGEARRFSAEIPEAYWEFIDYSATALELGAGGTVTAEVRTVVPAIVTLRLWDCDEERTPEERTSTTPALDHRFVFPDHLGPGGCAFASVRAEDPTGERLPDGSEIAGVRRGLVTAQVTTEVEVVAVPDGGFPVRGAVGQGLARRLWGCIPGPAVVDTRTETWSLRSRTARTFVVDFLGGCPGETPAPDDVVVDAIVDLADLQAGPVVVDQVQPDGLHLRFRLTADRITLPR